MKKQISSMLALIILIFICTSGIIEPITKVVIWLVTLNYNSPEISIVGQLIVKYGTWVITFALVGKIFRVLKWFNSTAMKITYFIISTILSFIFSWLIMILEKYYLVILIIIIALLILLLIIIIILLIKKYRNKEAI